MIDLDIDRLRAEELPAFEEGIFLNAASGAPMCRSAVDAAVGMLTEMGRCGDRRFETYLARMSEARRLIAAYLNAELEEIAFTANSSSSAAVMARMLRAAGVQRIYHPKGEFPTSTHAVRNLGIPAVALGDPELRDASAEWLEALEKTLVMERPAKGTRALIASHVCFLNGTTLDIGAAATLCRKYGLILCINATQSFGALAINVAEGIDILFGTGLKWAGAGFGTGFLFLRQGLVDTFGLPKLTGWLSVPHPGQMDNAVYEPVPSARALDAGGGAPPFGNILALWGALKMYEKIGEGHIREGILAVQARIRALAGHLRQGLLQAGFDVIGDLSTPPQSGIVSCLSEEAGLMTERLASEQIYISLRNHPATGRQTIARFGVHFAVKKEEIDRALYVLSQMRR